MNEYTEQWLWLHKESTRQGIRAKEYKKYLNKNDHPHSLCVAMSCMYNLPWDVKKALKRSVKKLTRHKNIAVSNNAKCIIRLMEGHDG